MLAFKDQYGAALAYHQLGIVMEIQGQLTEAELTVRRRSKYPRPDDRHGAAGTYHQLGVVAEAQRRFAEAGYYKKVLETMLAFKDQYGAAQAYYQLGSLAKKQGQLVEAKNYYKEALEIFLVFKDQYKITITLHSFATVVSLKTALTRYPKPLPNLWAGAENRGGGAAERGARRGPALG